MYIKDVLCHQVSDYDRNVIYGADLIALKIWRKFHLETMVCYWDVSAPKRFGAKKVWKLKVILNVHSSRSLIKFLM